ncbi:MAG TPA: PAS domain S-box protein [Pyrinomonadaceae bacterium]|nr:PAS domain S-box protein [Pyrinomonadaceae bacterium]
MLPKNTGFLNIFTKPQLWMRAIIVLSFVICGSVFWVHSHQRQTYKKTVLALENIHHAHNELTKGLLYTSLSNDSTMPFEQTQGLVLLDQAVNSLEDAVNASSRNSIGSIPETVEAINNYRRSLEEFKTKQAEWNRTKDNSPKTKTDIRITFTKLENQADEIENLTKKNLENLSYRLNLEFGIVYLLGFLLLGGGGIAMFLSQKAEQKSVQKLRNTQEQLQQVIKTTNVGLWDWDIKTGKIFYSPEWKNIIGYKDAEIGEDISEWKDRIHPDDILGVISQLKEGVHTSTQSGQTEFRLKHKDGSYRWMICSASAFYEKGVPVRFFGVNVDITDIKQTEEKLRQSERQFKTLVDEAPESIYIQSEGKFAYINQTAVKMFGAESYKDLIGTPVMERIPPEAKTRVANIIQTFNLQKRQLPLFEEVFLKIDGSSGVGEITAIPFEYGGKDGALVFVRETTQKKRLEEELLQSKKMDSIGRLAGGIAHDFNNLLTVIMSYTALASRNVVNNEKVSAYLENIKTASERAAKLTNQLLAFARKQIISPHNLSLNDEINKIYGLIARLIGEDIEIKLFLRENLWQIKADEGQIEQILINLAANARDAMPKGGKLTIETDNVFLDESYTSKHQDVTPGEFVQLSVSDNGSGMDKAIQEHIFEPFFTTKEIGKGTGLGLAMCHGIIKQNGGHIWLYSEPGQGTTFKIYLPRVTESEKPISQNEFPKEIKGTETILLVEDEAMVRGITVETLRTFGYNIIECGSGKEAIEKAKSHKDKIHLLLTDVVMPGMSGKELSLELQKIIPELRILYVSGYTENTIVHHGILEDEVEFVPKPYNINHLATKVREVLDK